MAGADNHTSLRNDTPGLTTDDWHEFDGLAWPCPKCRERTRTLEQLIGYEFQHVPLLFKALTHSSYAHEHPQRGLRHNERLEFLGDAVLGLVLTEHLFRRFPDRWEGELSLMRSWLVSESNLADIAQQINLGYYVLLGRGEERCGGRTRAALLADVLEALIGAVYLDGGFLAARSLIERLFADKLATVDSDKLKIDYKNALQRTLHPRALHDIRYVVTSTSGPQHQRQFIVEVQAGPHVLGRGSGWSKKEAEMNAARDALERLAEAEGALAHEQNEVEEDS